MSGKSRTVSNSWTMSPVPADRLQGVADIPFDHGRRHAFAVRAGLAEQLTHVGKLGGFFRIRELSRRNDLADHVAAEGYFHAVCVKRKRSNELPDGGWRGVNVDPFHSQ